jgi:YaiO family outer membrane protein
MKITPLTGLLMSLLWVTTQARADYDRQIELGAESSTLSDGNSAWKGGFVRPTARITPTDVVSGEIHYAERFSENGIYAGANLQHDYNSDWYQTFSLGLSSGGRFWPQTAIASSLFHKWLDDKSLITGFGITRNTYSFGASDLAFTAEAIYYFPSFLVLEGGYRYNLSFPGTITAGRAFAALTIGYGSRQQLVLRYDAGREAYKPVGDGQIEVAFNSQSYAAIARTDLGMAYGLSLGLEHYRNAFYFRNSATLSIIKAF